ncbi:MAG: hypothetical protein JO075_14485 [Acidimicrobiia bacterium]|nr:hypothetical protein [Acidimicrobiia bacterium]
MKVRRMPFVACAAVAAAAVLSACSGGASSTTSQPANPAADKAAAIKINLRPSDFPTGWTSSPHQPSAQEAATLQQLAQCVGIPDLAGHTTAMERSPDFSAGQTTSANSNVTFVKTAADASNDLAAFQSAKTPDCLKQTVVALVRQQLPGATPANLDVRQLQFPTLKDGTAAYQASFTISAAGTNLPVYADFIYFRSGRAEIALVTINAGSPFDPKLEQQLAKNMAARS